MRRNRQVVRVIRSFRKAPWNIQNVWMRSLRELWFSGDIKKSSLTKRVLTMCCRTFAIANRKMMAPALRQAVVLYYKTVGVWVVSAVVSFLTVFRGNSKYLWRFLGFLKLCYWSRPDFSVVFCSLHQFMCTILFSKLLWFCGSLLLSALHLFEQNDLRQMWCGTRRIVIEPYDSWCSF